MNLAAAVVSLVLAFQSGISADGHGPSARATLIELRHVVYDSMYRNDADGLRLAIAALEKLTDRAGSTERPYVRYYSSVAHWALSAAQLQAGDAPGGLRSAQAAVAHARAGLELRPEDPEFHAVLANGLIVVAILDQPNFMTTAKELASIRKQALLLGPANPRVVVMDAGMIFNNPPSRGGGQERGLTRWREALALFEREASAPGGDVLAPSWGHALAWGWLANLLQKAEGDRMAVAREAAAAALQMRPDFWYVREQVIPRLK